MSRFIHIVANGDIYFHGMTFRCVCSPYQYNLKQVEKKILSFIMGGSDAIPVPQLVLDLSIKMTGGPMAEHKAKVGILGPRRKGQMQERRGTFSAMPWSR